MALISQSSGNSSLSSKGTKHTGPASSFIGRLRISIAAMTVREKRLTVILLLLALTLSVVKGYGTYQTQTKMVPADGGRYREGVVGELKYLNPIWVQSDADKSVSKLMFSGLVRIERETILPDVAESWSVSDDGRRYVFNLRSDVVFHDGSKLTADDVAYTIESIKLSSNGNSKSPLFEVWQGVSVVVESDHTLVLELPRSNGPFIYYADFGIMPHHISSDEFARRFIGSGPYQLVNATMAGSQISQLQLKRNDQYYGGRPYLEFFDLSFYSDQSAALQVFQKGEVNALFGAMPAQGNVSNMSYLSAKRLGLLFNLRNEKLQDKELRRKIVTGETLENKVELTLTALNSPTQQSLVDELKTKLGRQNIELQVQSLGMVQLREVIDSKTYELLLYGFDFSRDRDPYLFWHSSQVERLNFAGYADRDSDIFLEDARGITDRATRDAKYNEFYEKLANEFVVIYYDPLSYVYVTDSKIKNIKPITGYEAASRYSQVNEWYIKERRTRK